MLQLHLWSVLSACDGSVRFLGRRVYVAVALTRWVHPRDGQTTVTVSSGRRRVPSCVWGSYEPGAAATCGPPVSGGLAHCFVLILMGG